MPCNEVLLPDVCFKYAHFPALLLKLVQCYTRYAEWWHFCKQDSDEYLPLQFYQDGEQMQLLSGQADSIDIDCPIRILHGMKDTIVPYSCSTKLLNCLKATDVHLTLVKVQRIHLK